jgi:hypothetical protein
MSIEADIFNTLKGLVSNRVYPDVAPAGTEKPFIVYQQAGGEAVNFLEAGAPVKRNARMQITCWATTRLAAATLARQAEDALTSSALKAFSIGALTAIYEDDTGLYGTRQDFSIWH